MGLFWCDTCGNVKCTCKQNAEQRTVAVAEVVPAKSTRATALTDAMLAAESPENLLSKRSQLRGVFVIEQFQAMFQTICVCGAILAFYLLLALLGARPLAALLLLPILVLIVVFF